MLNSLELNTINCVDSQDNEPIEIIKGLYLGSCFASYNKEALIKRNVKYIVNCSSEDNVYGHEFVYLHVRVKDKEGFNFLSSLYYSVDFIAEGLQKGSVFVYCSRGRCRSVSTIAGFLMTFCKMSFDDTLQLLYTKRPQMKINDSFLLQLRFYYECDCSIHLASQLFMLYELSILYNRMITKSRSSKTLQQYRASIPAYVEICYPDQAPRRLPLPRYIAKQFHCCACHTSLFRYHNLLDHRNINYQELMTALLSITENQSQVHTVHCIPEFIHDTLFRKSRFDRSCETPHPNLHSTFGEMIGEFSNAESSMGYHPSDVLHEGEIFTSESRRSEESHPSNVLLHEGETLISESTFNSLRVDLPNFNSLQTDISNLQLSVLPNQTSLVDLYPTREDSVIQESTMPVLGCEPSLALNSISYSAAPPTLCEELPISNLSTIQLNNKSHSCILQTDLSVAIQSDSSQESMSAPESAVCSPINRQGNDVDSQHLIEIEENDDDDLYTTDHTKSISRGNRETSDVKEVRSRVRMKRSIFDELDDDDDNLDNLIFDTKKVDTKQFQYHVQPIAKGHVDFQGQYGIPANGVQHLSPSPPMYLTDQFIINNFSFDKKIRLLPHEYADYRKEDVEPGSCDKYFVEPLEWMMKEVIEQQANIGILRCPNPECNTVVGGFSLLSDQSCNCGFSPFTYFYFSKDCVI